MALRVGINGFGRIGRLVFRVLAERPLDFDVVAINDLSDPKHLALLLKYDSVQGRFKGTVEAREKSIVVNGTEIPITVEKDPAALPWKKLNCQVVLESTGRFTDRASLMKHIDAGAERVVLSRPPRMTSTRRSSWASTIRSSTRTTGSSPTRPARPTAWLPWQKCCTSRSGSRRG